MDRPRERRLEGIKDRTNLPGKLVVNPLKPPPRDSGLAPVDAARYGVAA